MMCADVEGGKSVRCNSTLENDDMNDLVFRIKRQ